MKPSLTQLYCGSSGRTGLGGTRPYLCPRIPTNIWLRHTSDRHSSVARSDSSSVTPQRSSTSCRWRQCCAARRRSSGKTLRTKMSRSECMSLKVEEINTRTPRHLRTEKSVHVRSALSVSILYNLSHREKKITLTWGCLLLTWHCLWSEGL